MNSFYTHSSSNSSNQFAGYSQRFGLQPADRIKDPIFQTGLSKHHAIYLGMDQHGQEWIAENHKLHGVRQVKSHEYFKDGNSYIIVPFEGSYQERFAAVKRALRVMGKPYDLIQYNCEHYASYVQTGTAESKKVGNAVAGLALGVLVAAILLND